jgi:hypothetical protein
VKTRQAAQIALRASGAAVAAAALVLLAIALPFAVLGAVAFALARSLGPPPAPRPESADTGENRPLGTQAAPVCEGGVSAPVVSCSVSPAEITNAIERPIESHGYRPSEQEAFCASFLAERCDEIDSIFLIDKASSGAVKVAFVAAEAERAPFEDSIEVIR